MANFDSIAPIYDQLAGLVFGGAIQKAQVVFLDQIENGQSVLILGGGTGLILEHLKLSNYSLKIDFIEPSSRMIEKAKKRVDNSSPLNINFYQERFEAFQSEKKYDWIHCGFFLDLFPRAELLKTISLIKAMMKANGKIWVSDFRIDEDHNRCWQKPMSQFMHLFFRSFAGLESKSLQDIQCELVNSGLGLNEEKRYYGRFIFSAVYTLNKN